jgi:16S rRNA (guanine(966)-N(2))-methyltransferase RsmD
VSGRIRVSAGLLKNRRLAINAAARPTSEKARAALFDILGSGIEGCRVLELFAGSGAVSIEALSRGAASATAVDRDASALLANRRALGLELEILAIPAEEAVVRLSGEKRLFDLIFLDPPYGTAAALPWAVALGGLLASAGLLVWQTDSSESPDPGAGFSLRRVARYGRNVLSFFERPSP